MLPLSSLIIPLPIWRLYFRIAHWESFKHHHVATLMYQILAFTAYCDPGCGEHGACTAPDKCTCDKGYGGATCRLFSCTAGCPAGRGLCTGPDQCTCLQGWSGHACSKGESPHRIISHNGVYIVVIYSAL